VWLEVDTSDKPDINEVYSLPITLTWELRADHIVLTVYTLHSDLSYISYDFDEIVQKKVSEQLSIEMQNMRI